MLRRDFLTLTGIGLGGLIAPPFFGRTIVAEELSSRLDMALKKRLADTALDAATKAGASYCDVRIGRYLQQFVITREDKVENVVNTESTGVGVRVLVKGTWGFAATSELTDAGRRRRGAASRRGRQGQREGTIRAGAARQGARRGRGLLGHADQEERDGGAGQGESRAAAGRQCRSDGGGRQLRELDPLPRQRTEVLRLDGRLVHRSGPASPLAAAEGHRVDQKSGKFRTPRQVFGRRWAWATSTSTAPRADKVHLPGGAIAYGKSYDMREDAIAAASTGAGEADGAVGRRRASTTWCWIPHTCGLRSTNRSAIRPSSIACWATKPTTPGPASRRWTSWKRSSGTAAKRSRCSPTRPRPTASAPSAMTTRA